MAIIRGYTEDEVDLLTADFERVVERSILSALQATTAGFRGAIVAASSAGMTAGDAAAITTHWDDEVDGVLTPYIGQLYTGSAASVAVGLADAFPDDLLPGVPLIADEFALTYMKTVTNRLYNVGDELWEDIRNELIDGIKQGQSIEQIAARVEAVSQFDPYRAQRIARTEVHGATESGSHAQISYMGYDDDEVTKEWLATHDLRTRETHSLASGQKRPLNEPFSVGGSLLPFPGYPGGAADEIINCRCSTAYDVKTTPKFRCNGSLAAAAKNEPTVCIIPTPKADISGLATQLVINIFNTFIKHKISPAYGGSKIKKVLDETRVELAVTQPEVAALSDEQLLAAIDNYYVPKAGTFSQKYSEWAQTAAGKKALSAAPKKVAAKAVASPIAPSQPAPSPSILQPPSASKFTILDDPGASGDGYAPGGQWGKYGSSGVLVRAKDAAGVPRFLLIQRGEKYLGSQKFKWQLPGGGLDEKEGPYEAAAREFWEETLAEKSYVESMTPLGEMVYDGGDGWKYTSIVAHADSTFKPKVSGSTGDAKWFTLDELQKMLDDGDIVKELAPTLKQLADELDDLAQTKIVTPPKLPAVAPKPNAGDIMYTGKTLGSHGAQVWKNPQTGERWLFKPQPKFATDLDIGTAKIQSKAAQTRPGIYEMDLGGQHGSIQFMFESSDAWPSGSFDPLTLSASDIATLQETQVFDWMISNFDTHSGQWIRLKDGTLFETDKGQAFKFFGKDKLDWDYVPVTPLGQDKLTYSKLWKAYVQGKDVTLTDPTTGPLGEYIDRLMAIDDKTYRKLLLPYASHFKSGKALDDFLDAAVARKNNLKKDFAEFWARAQAERAKNLPKPIPTPAPAPPPTPVVAPPATITPTPSGAYGDISHVSSSIKKVLSDQWITLGGGKKVTPAWGGSKIWKQLEALKQWTKGDSEMESLSELQLLRILDEKGGFAGKPKTYESVLKEWLASPAGQKAVIDVPASLKPKPVPSASAPLVPSTPAITPIVSPTATFADEATEVLATGPSAGPKQIIAELTKYENGDIVAYGENYGTTYKVLRSSDTEFDIYVLQSGPNGKWLTLVKDTKFQSNLTGINWHLKSPPTKFVASKIPGKVPGDEVSIDDIEASKFLWHDGDIVAEKHTGAYDYQLKSDGKGGFTLWAKPSNETYYQNLTFGDPINMLTKVKTLTVGQQPGWKLHADAMQGTKKSAVPDVKAGDGMTSNDVMSANPHNGATIAYGLNDGTKTQYKVMQFQGAKHIYYKLNGDTTWNALGGVADDSQMMSWTGVPKWYAASANGGPSDAFKVLTGQPVSGVKTQSHAKGFFVGDQMDDQDIMDSVFDNPLPGSVIAKATSTAGHDWRIIYDTDDQLHAQFYDTLNKKWIDSGEIASIDEVPTMSTGWKASADSVTASKPVPLKTTPTVKKAAKKAATPAPTLPQNPPGVYIPGKKVGDVEYNTNIWANYVHYPDGQIIATKPAGWAGGAQRLVMIDGKLVFQSQTKAGVWTKTKVMTQKYDFYGGWTLSDQMLDAATQKKLSKVVAKQSVPKPYTYTPAAAKKATTSYGGGGGYVPSASFKPRVVDVSAWNNAEQLEMFTFFRSQNAYTASSPENIWAAIQKTKQTFQAKYGGKYAKLNEYELLHIVDEQRALKKSVTNEHWYESSISGWLKSPGGKAYINKKIDAPIAAHDVPEPMIDLTGTRSGVTAPDPDKQTYEVVTKSQSFANREKSHQVYGGWKTGEKEALRGYTSGSYTQWNAAIRSGDISSYRDKIVKAQNGMRPSVRPMMLHRGASFQEFNDPSIQSYEDLLPYVGSTYVNRGFNSSSFGGRAGFSGQVLFEIEAPVGTPMSHAADYSHFPGENEVTLAAHLIYKIMSVTKKGGTTVVRVRVIGAAQP